MYTTKGKQGFTLAEVLVTLAIIGVVAALTIPTLLQSANQAKYTTGLKKSISVLSQALEMNNANNSSVSSVTANSDSALAAWFKPNLSTLADDTNGLLTLADGSKLQFKNTSPGVDTTGCTGAHLDVNGLCTGYGASPDGLPAGLTAAVCPTIPSTGTVPAVGYCLVYVDVNGGKLPNKVSTSTAINDIYVLGIDNQGVKAISAAAGLTVPIAFATGESAPVTPANSSINAMTQ